MNTQPTIIFAAVGLTPVTLTFINTANTAKNIFLKGGTEEVNGQMGANATSVYSMTLTTGESIIAYGAAEINVTANVPLVSIQISGLVQPILDTAQTAVGVALGNLTQAQIRSLLAIMLYKAGGVNLNSLTVRPLAEWAL